MNENIHNLLHLIAENPDLPVVPMVDSEVVADECGYWRGSWGSASVQEVYEGKERIFFRDDEDDELIDRVLEDYLPADEYKALDESPTATEAMREEIKKVPWKKCIMVYIDLPEPEIVP